MRILGWVLGAIGVILVLLSLLWFGYGFYVDRVVGRYPSTSVLINTGEGEVHLGQYLNGDQQLPVALSLSPLNSPPSQTMAPLTAQPDSAPAPAVAPVPSLPDPSPSQAMEPLVLSNLTSAARSSEPVLPPTRIAIEKIQVDYPIVLADNDNLPKFKGVGWYMGTGYPGFRGNMVLFGHLNGDYETFGRLGELKLGDKLTVQAMERSYEYTVTAIKVVTKDDVSVLAPSRDSLATLITCTGTFFPATRDYSHRLIISAQLDATAPH